MRTREKKYRLGLIASIMMLMLAMGSCEDYLDKAPEADITENDVFGNFNSFQGFIEELYHCVTDYNKAGAWNQFLFADETLYSSPSQFDLGNYWSQAALFYSATANTDQDPRSKRIWPLCWYGIRKANMALAKIDLLIDATQEQKDLIKGQALFYRGWFYFELMRYWGGLPYVDHLLTPTEELKLPRLNYRETALKAAKDFQEAALLLPANWDNTEAGQFTLGHNKQRVSKVHALSYLGKNLLYAASPMMNEESTGNNSFDAELCKQAAEAFAEAIRVSDQSGAFKLHSWADWSLNFWIYQRDYISGGTEVIMNPPVYQASRVQSSTVYATVPKALGGSNTAEVPAHNYVKNYGMANGLPIDDPASGYDPNNPWVNREPRFYVDIIVDGDELAAVTAAGPDRYAQLYNGGRHRDGDNGSSTGYYYKRWSPKGSNKWEGRWTQLQAYVPYMRLADVYLMYAEAALHGYGSPSGGVSGFMTAEQALNVIRNRAQLPNVDAKFTASKEAFMEILIRERAVELAFEGHRFNDLRRWNVAGELKYREKTAIDFDRDENGKPVNIRERLVTTRVFDKKHNWLPMQVRFTTNYKEFPQNPGW